MTSAQTSPLLPNNNNSKEDTKDIIALDQIQIEDDDGTTQTTPEGNEMGRVNVNTSNLSNAELLHRERMKPEQHAKDGNSGSPHSQRWYQTVVFAVSFYMATSIVMVIVNKAVLNAVSLPITFLWLQIVVAVALIYGCHFAGLWKLPSKLDPVVVRGLLPLVSINVIGLTFNTLCLTFVDASLYQVARSLILPLTVAFSWIVLKKPSSMAVIAACSVVVSGFLVGTLLEDKELKISFWGIAFGVFSSFTTAMHAVVISKSLDVVNGSLSDLVFYNNLLSLVGLLPVVVFSGELGGLGAVLASDNLKTFVGFRICFVLRSFFLILNRADMIAVPASKIALGNAHHRLLWLPHQRGRLPPNQSDQPHHPHDLIRHARCDPDGPRSLVLWRCDHGTETHWDHAHFGRIVVLYLGQGN